jgi:hypothetical protein
MTPATELRIRIKKATPEQLQSLGLKSWPIWEKEVSTFPYHYDETC